MDQRRVGLKLGGLSNGFRHGRPARGLNSWRSLGGWISRTILGVEHHFRFVLTNPNKPTLRPRLPSSRFRQPIRKSGEFPVPDAETAIRSGMMKGT